MTHPGVTYREGDSVAPGEYRALRAEVGWSDPDVTDAALGAALSSGWSLTARTAEGALIGLARVLDDGALYASIWDVLVTPSQQRRGIGTELLGRAVRRVADRSLVALIATSAGAALYSRAGFVKGDERSSGMFRRG